MGSGSGSLLRKGKEESFPSSHPYYLLGVSQASGPGTEKQRGQVSRVQIQDFIEGDQHEQGVMYPLGTLRNTLQISHTHTLTHLCVCVCVYIP